MKLTEAQRRALEKLDIASDWKSPYFLQESMSTLQALQVRGLADIRGGVGAFSFPRTSTAYRITEKGKAEIR